MLSFLSLSFLTASVTAVIILIGESLGAANRRSEDGHRGRSIRTPQVLANRRTRDRGTPWRFLKKVRLNLGNRAS